MRDITEFMMYKCHIPASYARDVYTYRTRMFEVLCYSISRHNQEHLPVLPLPLSHAQCPLIAPSQYSRTPPSS
jgi:hypothetical protein